MLKTKQFWGSIFKRQINNQGKEYKNAREFTMFILNLAVAIAICGAKNTSVCNKGSLIGQIYFEEFKWFQKKKRQQSSLYLLLQKHQFQKAH